MFGLYGYFYLLTSAQKILHSQSTEFKTLIMRFESNAKEGQDSLQTFFQWCKENKGKSIAQKYVVTKVWTPNKFPDLNLETEKFRLRVFHKSQTFKAISEALTKLIESGAVLAISEIDTETHDYVLEVLEGESGDWSQLGSTGWLCEVRDKPKKSSRRGRKNSA